jgi:hypothetical protein
MKTVDVGVMIAKLEALIERQRENENTESDEQKD